MQVLPKRRTALVTAAAMLLCSGCGRQEPPAAPSVRDVFAMDTYMSLKVWSAEGDELLDAGAARIEELEAMLSVTRETSEIGRANAGETVAMSRETAAILQTALTIGEETGGALDVSVYPVSRAWGFTTDAAHVPDAGTIRTLLADVDFRRIQPEGDTLTLPAGMQIDLGALAKGYTSDALMEMFRQGGAASAIVSLGGNVQTLGTKPDGSAWKVGIVNPFSPQENLCVVEVSDQAVITSGNYERYFEENGTRYHHIIDPADGYPADSGLVSATVIGSSGLLCDARSTALFVLGEEAAVSYWRAHDDFEMILVTDDARILYTEGIAAAFQNLSDAPAEVIARE